MFRTPDIPLKPRKEFNKDEYEEELIWLKRKNDGIIKSSITSGGWVLALTTSLLLSFVSMYFSSPIQTGIVWTTTRPARNCASNSVRLWTRILPREPRHANTSPLSVREAC